MISDEIVKSLYQWSPAWIALVVAIGFKLKYEIEKMKLDNLKTKNDITKGDLEIEKLQLDIIKLKNEIDKHNEEKKVTEKNTKKNGSNSRQK